MIEGHCLCGAVTIRAERLGEEISACFCELCVRWGGGLQMGIDAPADAVRIDGPVKVHRSSRLAERAWCDTCGSALFFRYVEGRDAGYLELSPGLFENAGGARLTRVVYADRAPDGLRLGGDYDSVSQAEYEAANDHLNAGDVS
jgi:hypothetical protein